MRMRVVMLPAWLDPPVVPGVRYIWWDHGEREPPSRELAEVEVFVAPYMPTVQDLLVTAAMPRLRVVQALMAGVDSLAPHLPDGVELLRAVGVHDTSTAELAVGMAIAMQRGIDVAARDMGVGLWRHERRPALADASVAIVGWGGVGQAIARRLEAFEVDISAFSRSGRGCQPIAAFDARLSDFGIVILAIPDQGRPFMHEGRLSAMQPGALLVNVGRGTLVDLDALKGHLWAGRLRAALDVTDPEPLPADHQLWDCPNLLITPHVGGDTEAFVPRARAMITERMQRLSATGRLV
jgi:phosphoglycerate dehydrogenase-like enzyme